MTELERVRSNGTEAVLADGARITDAGLSSARDFMRRLTLDLHEEQLRAQPHALFSPIGWHVGHVAWQEEVWLQRKALGKAPLAPELDGVFDSFSSEKSVRGRALPDARELWAYVDAVRERTAKHLSELDVDAGMALMRGRNLLRFVANHERQHAEIVATIRLLGGYFLDASSVEPLATSARHAPHAAELGISGRANEPSAAQFERAPPSGHIEYVRVGGGIFALGNHADPDGWDNERMAHSVAVGDFCIGRYPVTAGQWLEFMAHGGYGDPRLWSPAGWQWRQSEEVVAPLFWRRADGGWLERTLCGEQLVDVFRPVAHVSWFEAEAFARFAGARLPSEVEWELAASWDRAAAHKRRWSWGDERSDAATVELKVLRPMPVGTSASTDAACGAADCCGGVWEWTSSVFAPYPGFQPQDYRGYSEPWFDGRHQVARGGSYVTALELARCCFRNWYLPELRQPCLGVRLAKDT